MSSRYNELLERELPKSSLNRELLVHRKTSCCKTIDQAADKGESLFLNVVGTQCKCTTLERNAEALLKTKLDREYF